MDQKPVVLIVDDEPEIGELVALFLEADFTSEVFSDSREAIASLKSKAYNFVLSDIRMPFVDGYEVLGEARRLHPNIKVILMTGHAQSPQDIANAKSMGALEVLSKPFGDPVKLVNLLKSHQR